MRVALREPATAGLILTMTGWEVQVGQAFSPDALSTRRSVPGTRAPGARSTTGTHRSQLSAVLENPEFSSFRSEKLGPGRVGGGIQDDLAMKDPPPRTVHRDEPITIPTSPEVAEYITARQLPPPPPPQQNKHRPSEDHGTVLAIPDEDAPFNGRSTTLFGSSTTTLGGTRRPTYELEKPEQAAVMLTTEATAIATATTTKTPIAEEFWARQASQRQEIWDDSRRQAESTTQLAKDWMKAALGSVMDRQQLSPQQIQQIQQQSEDTIKAQNDDINLLQRLLRWRLAADSNAQHEQTHSESADQIQPEPISRFPSATTDALSDKEKTVNTLSPFLSATTIVEPTSSSTMTDTKTDASGVPDDIDYETRQKYENWKRTREQLSKTVNVIQDTDIPPTQTTTDAAYSPPPRPSTSMPGAAQTRRMDPLQFTKKDQTIIVQAVRKDAKTNASTYSADFVSGRTEQTIPQTLPIRISRPFFIESPEDLFFVDIGEAAMIKLAIEAQQSYYYPEKQKLAGVSAPNGAGNWESGPYEYRVSTTPEIDQPKSWLGSLLSKFRVARENRPSDRITPMNPKDEYTEFAVRRMPSGTLSSRQRYERLLQRSAYRSPYGYSYPRTRTRQMSRVQGSDLFPSPWGDHPWMEPPPTASFFDYDLTRPRSRPRVRQRRRRPPPPPPYYPPRQFYD